MTALSEMAVVSLPASCSVVRLSFSDSEQERVADADLQDCWIND